MLRFAVDFHHPIAIRYPRGAAYEGMQQFRAPIEYGKSEVLYEEEDIAIIFVGTYGRAGRQCASKPERDRVQLQPHQCPVCQAAGYAAFGRACKRTIFCL